MAAAAAPHRRAGSPESVWPRWVASLGSHPPAEISGFSRVILSRSERTFAFFSDSAHCQPAVASERRSAVIFEGVLYNGDRLRERLGIDRPASDDAALLLEGYRRWGEALLRELSGIFALAIWDGDRNTLLCARDAMGNHPFFYARSGEEFVFSTSLELLLLHPAVSKELNRTAIVSYLIDHWPRLNETFYSHVERIPPGHAMRVSRGSENLFRYWDPAPGDSASKWITEDELESFDELLSRAVDRCLTLGPVGIYLSGGLDSVSVAAVATDRCAAGGLPAPHALSLGFADPEANEQQVQTGVASRLGIQQDLVPFAVACGPEGLLLPILRLSRSMSHPLQNFWLAAYNHLAQLGKQHGCRAILTGAGGDEWLGLSPYLAADYIRSFDYSGLRRLWLGQHRSFAGPLLAKAWFLFWRFGIRALMRDTTIRTLRKSRPSVYAAVMRRRIQGLVGQRPWLEVDEALLREIYQRAETSETERANESGRIGLYTAEGRRALDHPLVSWEMEEVFENGGRMGIRFLAPYYDAELIEMLYRVPPKLLIRGGRTRGSSGNELLAVFQPWDLNLKGRSR